MKKSKMRLLAVLTVMIMMLTTSVMMTACGSDEAKGANQTEVKTEQMAESQDAADSSQEKVSEDSAKSTSEAKKSESSSGTKSSEKNGAKSTQATQSTKATQATQATKAAVCYVSVEGYCSSKTITLQGGDTAYSVLKRTGATVSGSSSYVKGINGLFEFDKGPQSGWMYSVNGAVPNVSAGSYSVKSGDQVRWYYVTSY